MSAQGVPPGFAQLPDLADALQVDTKDVAALCVELQKLSHDDLMLFARLVGKATAVRIARVLGS